MVSIMSVISVPGKVVNARKLEMPLVRMAPDCAMR